MHLRSSVIAAALGLAAISACADRNDPAGLAADHQATDFAAGAGIISGTVYGFIPPSDRSDSLLLPLAGVRLAAFRLADLPRDSLPPPPPPPDSIPTDTIPGPPPPDTTPGPPPPPPPPPDTMLTGGTGMVLVLGDSVVGPPDSVPLPPPARCTDGGMLVTAVSSGENGSFRLTGLPSGIYAIRAVPKDGLGFKPGGLCGIPLRPDQHLANVPIVLLKP
ncbi:MAG: carboxypeptidase-like regulatory domain-containing protein [Gemmatimonadales bacterium]